MKNKFAKMLIVELENGDRIEKYVSKKDIEGLKFGFLDMSDFVDVKWHCEDKGIEELEIKSYYYKEVEAEDLIEANEFLEELTEAI